MFIIRCDDCKKVEAEVSTVTFTPSGWQEVTVEARGMRSPHTTQKVRVLLCPGCSSERGLTERQLTNAYQGRHQSESALAVLDAVADMVREIAHDVCDERGVS